MDNKLIDTSIRTMIGQLPTIINYNNDMIENEFALIMDPSTRKMKLDVESNNVKAITGMFTNLVVNNVQIDSSSLENYKSLRNDLNDVSARLSGASPMTYSASYVNEDIAVQSSNEVDFSLFFQGTDFTDHRITGITTGKLYGKTLYMTLNGIRIPLSIMPETFNNEQYVVVYYDHMMTNWNTMERTYVRLADDKENNSIIALSSPISKKFKLSN